jgi:hypothetical protein
MDNRLFNVNGEGDAMLLRALELVFEQDNMKDAAAYRVDKEKGLILLWHRPDGRESTPFPSDLTPKEVLPIVSAWLKSDEAKKVKGGKWEDDYEHDGSNSEGWRVYCEDWGHIGDETYAICAIKHVYLWHGK